MSGQLADQIINLQTDLETLKSAVSAMRNAQREYFRTRSSSALEVAKRAEKRVDVKTIAALPVGDVKLMGRALIP